MRKSHHIKARMNQRGISDSLITLLSTFGIVQDGQISLSRGNREHVSKVLTKLKRQLDRMAEKGGYTMVSVDDVLLTVYRN